MVQRRKLTGVAGIMAAFLCTGDAFAASATTPEAPVASNDEVPVTTVETDKDDDLPKVKPMAPFVKKSINWLIEAQHEDGGWGDTPASP